MPRNKKQENKKDVKKQKKEKGISILKYFIDGKKEDLPLDKKIFNIKIDPKNLALYVRVYLANQRQGTASTKTRSEVSGSTRKIYRQKGTGRARHGDIKAPIFVGGGVVFGPKPRDYSLKLNKKQKKKALLEALVYQFKQGKLLIYDNELLQIKPKTKNLSSFLEKNDLAKEKKLIVLPKMEKNNLILAGRNIPNLNFTSLESLNAYNLLVSQKVIFLEDAFNNLIKKYAN
jgi:large subunit ribosomal protein L4